MYACSTTRRLQFCATTAPSLPDLRQPLAPWLPYQALQRTLKTCPSHERFVISSFPDFPFCPLPFPLRHLAWQQQRSHGTARPCCCELRRESFPVRPEGHHGQRLRSAEATSHGSRQSDSLNWHFPRYRVRAAILALQPCPTCGFRTSVTILLFPWGFLASRLSSLPATSPAGRAQSSKPSQA